MRKLISLILPTLLLTSLSAVETDPVGAMKLTMKAESDTIVGLGFIRSPEFEGIVDSVSGDVITLSGTPAFDDDQFIYSAGVQENTYYVLVLTGEREGMYYTITDNGDATLTVDTAGDTLEGNVVNGNRIQIVPFWTFATLFPDQEGIVTTNSISGANAGTAILLNDPSKPGKNRASSDIYYYYVGALFGGDGWRKKGIDFNLKLDDDVIPPDSYFVYRNSTSNDVNIVISGAVQMASFRTIVGTIESDVDQDNKISITIPVDMTLAESNLFEQGIIDGTNSPSGAGAELVMTFNNSESSINKAATNLYYYYTGTLFGGAGWRKKGVDFNTKFDNEPALTHGQGVLIRKNPKASPHLDFWTVTPNYLQ